jgi:dihydrofolate reductase
MIAIFAADSEWGIGRGVRLPWRLPGDLAYFKERTTGGVVVMGRRTFESLAADAGPGTEGEGSGPKPLPNRTNIVLTRDSEYSVPGVTVAHSVDELLRRLRESEKERASGGGAEGTDAPGGSGEAPGGVYVCGGADVYRLLMPYTDACLVTRIDASFGADTFFPIEEENADGSGFTAKGPDGETRSFVLTGESPPVTETDLLSGRIVSYRFCEYSARTQ